MTEEAPPPPPLSGAPRSGSGADLVALYLEKRADLVRFFTARTGSPAEAEDIVQEIYLKVARASGAEVANGAAWLYRLGSNVLLDRVRGARRSARRDAGWRDVSATTLGAEDIQDSPPPEEAIDARRRVERLAEALSDLPPQARRVFALHKLEGLSHSEVAAQLGISRSAVEKHVMAALKRLTAKLGPGVGMRAAREKDIGSTGGSARSAASLGGRDLPDDRGGDMEP
jgi:RNA polymerase sigma-70 factor (ECF subfamily)